MDKPAVLLVDDNDSTITLVTALLQREFSIETATDGAEAVEKLKTKNYAAVLLDLRMPVIDGFGVLDFLKQNKPAMLQRVLVVTAALTRNESSRATEYGVCGVIAKPFEVESLLAAVKQCVDPALLNNRGPLLSGGMLLLLADMLRQRFM